MYKLKRWHVLLTDELYRRIREVAKRDDRSIANMTARLIEEALAARAEKPKENR